MKKPTVLIVDDEKSTREGLARALRRTYRVLLAEDGARALSLLSEEAVDIVLSDLRMPGMDGLTLIQRILARTPQPVCILLTAYGSIETAVEAMKRGAFDFLTKPVHLDELDLVLQRALRTREMEVENRQLREQLDTRFGLENMVGQSPAMREVFETIRQVAPSRASILIQGETGTGKELVARAIHQLSPRAKAPLITVHCAALPATLLESELFGHEKGAFTGATERRQGRFELADGGSLFLDEIGEIDQNVQVKILRVLDQRTFERVGGRDTHEVDVRLIAATNKNLEEMVQEGTFREDLLYRLNVITLTLPPLRDRADDIPLLVQRFLSEFSAENQKAIDGVTPDCMNALLAYHWPGNIRELRNVVERMVVLSRQDRLSVRDLPPALRETAGNGPATTATLPGASLSLEAAEKHMIMQALDTHNGNRTKAAQQLGISRRTLHRKLNEYGLRDGESTPPDHPE
jgi:two-component system, NtrC family, response regulator AtoC